MAFSSWGRRRAAGAACTIWDMPPASESQPAQQPQVAVLDGQNKIKFTSITIGRDLGTEVEVTHGLSKSDRIVSNPGERLADGVEVQVINKEALANQTDNPSREREAMAK